MAPRLRLTKGQPTQLNDQSFTLINHARRWLLAAGIASTLLRMAQESV